ncbi:hypothetical protein D187_006901 [Cystobacter fuscus DSM 2262]|uniref:Uncharacterized protein n=1 Tax=Cystobacter fuscus (strain ATCC 25194 / DSM 2262 / NBRC 100088 / M29) TaxID=1242864 RepID=S9P4L4_CYSF2|nr:hypothetical protein D187_006901 [Cystobacter fuscus DSM 2262]
MHRLLMRAPDHSGSPTVPERSRPWRGRRMAGEFFRMLTF